MPYLKAADDEHLSEEYCGQRLIYGNRYIMCENGGYLLCDFKTDQLIRKISVKQNEKGIDTEDRVVRLKKYIRRAGL